MFIHMKKFFFKIFVKVLNMPYNLVIVSHTHYCSNSYICCLIYTLNGSSDGKESACNAGDLGSVPGRGDALEEGMATHSSTLAWRIP